MKIQIGAFAAVCAIACSTADTTADTETDIAPEAAPPPTAAQRLTAPAADEPTEGSSTQATCRPFMQRMRACSETFIPALVEARVQRDDPPGLAAQDARIGREALVKEAFDEWANDSKDTAIDATCEHIAQAVAPARHGELRAAVGACMEQSGCDAFVPCAVAASLGRWKQ
jgi:hypothetical protein